MFSPRLPCVSRLLLLDGHSLAYRAFFALPVENFSTTTGQHTNAVYGFTSMLINLLRDEEPTHLAVTFDVSRQTFRSQEYAEYKAGRSTTPAEFVGQVSLVREVLDALRIRFVEVEGYEADDVIATLTEQAVVARAAGADEADALANLHWSAKEAALKVLQLGLRVDTHRVHVTLDAQPVWTGWNTLSVEALDQHFPGYWRRFGQFVLTVCFAPGGRPDSPPALLHGGADLTAAEPMHTWVQRPLVGGGQ